MKRQPLNTHSFFNTNQTSGVTLHPYDIRIIRTNARTHPWRFFWTYLYVNSKILQTDSSRLSELSIRSFWVIKDILPMKFWNLVRAHGSGSVVVLSSIPSPVAACVGDEGRQTLLDPCIPSLSFQFTIFIESK